MYMFSSIPGYHYLTKLTVSWVLTVKDLGLNRFISVTHYIFNQKGNFNIFRSTFKSVIKFHAVSLLCRLPKILPRPTEWQCLWI